MPYKVIEINNAANSYIVENIDNKKHYSHPMIQGIEFVEGEIFESELEVIEIK